MKNEIEKVASLSEIERHVSECAATDDIVCQVRNYEASWGSETSYYIKIEIAAWSLEEQNPNYDNSIEGYYKIRLSDHKNQSFFSSTEADYNVLYDNREGFDAFTPWPIAFADVFSDIVSELAWEVN